MPKINPYADVKEKMAGVTSIDRRTGDTFNPFTFGATQKSGSRPQSETERLFDNGGTVNADSKKDLLDKIAGILDGASNGTYDVENRAMNRSAGFSYEDQAFVNHALSNPGSDEFSMVGQSLMNPIKEIIDYETVTSKCWMPRSVKAGEIIRYDKDPFVVGQMIAEDGQTPQSVVDGLYIYPPEFEISAYPSITLKDQARAQFDIMARIQDRARQAMEYQLDLAGVNLWQAGGNAVNNTTFFATLNLGALESMRYQVERHRLVLDKFVIHRQEVSDMVNTVSTQVDPVTQRELVMAGYIGSILNAQVLTTAGTNTYEILEPGEVVALTTPEYLGGMAIRQEMMSEPVNEFHEGRPRRGWYWYMLLALALINPAGVALGSKTS